MEWLNNSWLVFVVALVVIAVMLWKVHDEHCGPNRNWFEEWEDWNNNRLQRWEDWDNNNLDA
ncbi:hypothetical protein UFOVP74_18 [uncultured Caudovirales phage]|uniref:Uncharacterized protein n=1 Tax=uncultured Caudovirales phage TaxID=2100421 RepID=A0A6J5KVM4_9CAUD|nr:hypothetical protein UFOVP74_18 [uncultured Caudovirales phage]